ncbi:MAG: BlaI/MecI/CopY family transcriptional regulator [Acidobacteria bacterium]|nr:BlaI/MecI/CopY family transcriptional regulator [Myxococcales bacterium]MCB1036869.1 BlaI/MecI/CopY family transcriptional regulator [Acidobacteriota bacterium]
MSEPKQLGDLQYAIMRVLWTEGECSAAEVHKALEEERGLAPTTIATMLQKMEKKGAVAFRREGRRFLYRPTVSEGEVRSSMVQELTHRLFDGDAAALVSHLIAEHEIDASELAQLQERIAQRQEEETH